MSLWVKICGNTTLADAQLAADAGADAVGFVFAPSPRRVTPEQVAAIVPGLPATVEKIGVFVETSEAEIAAIVARCGLTGVQLHGAGGDDMPRGLRARFGPALRILRVVHFSAAADEAVRAAAADPAVDAVLVDSRTATAVGGTGVAFDWHAARATVFTGGLKLVAAGGLTPENVAEAIRMLGPWGVDAVSGVEAAPGRKDGAKVRAFIQNARLAAG